MIKFLIFLTLSTGCIAPTKARVAAMVVGNAALLCDVSQTLWMSNGGRWDRGWRESNPILGSAPSETQIYSYAATVLVINTALTLLLRPAESTVWSFSFAALETTNVMTQLHNPVDRWYSDSPCKL